MADTEGYVLLDTGGLVQHSYHIGKDPEGLTGEDDKPYNTAGWGMAKLFEAYPLFESIPPRKIIAVWDGGNDYRKGLWDEYKKKRHEQKALTDPVKAEQMALLDEYAHGFLSSLGVIQVKVPGVEADDTIAMLCNRMRTNTLIIYTVDADLIQLAADYPNVQVIMKAVPIEDDYQNSKMVNPCPISLIRLNKSIVGDSSDEYPGVVGMGDVAWDNLHKEYGTDGMLQLESIIELRDRATLKAMADHSGDKNLHKLSEQFEHWYKQFQIAQLYTNICDGVFKRKLIRPEWSKKIFSMAGLDRVLGDAGLASMARRFKHWGPNYMLADQSEQGGVYLAHFRDYVATAPVCGFDYESYDTLKHPAFQEAKSKSSGDYVDVLSQRVTGVSFCYGDNFQHVIYMPCRHREEEGGAKNYEPGHVAWAVNYACDATQLIAHNASFESTLTINDLNLKLSKTIWDTYPMASHVDEDALAGLKKLSKDNLGYFQGTYKDLLEKYGAEDMSQLTPEQVLNYGCDDSLVTCNLFDLFWLITTVEGSWNFIREREFEFVEEQVRGFLTGVRFDNDVIHKLDEEATVELADSRKILEAGLEAHCSQPNMGGATALYHKLLAFEEAKAKEAELDPAEFEKKKEVLWENIYMASKYIPYQEIRAEVTVNPTPKPLTNAARVLGFTSPVIEKTSLAYLKEWVMNATAEAEADKEAGSNEKCLYLKRLTDAVNAKAWKTKDGEEYLALAATVSGLLGDTGKVETVGDELNFNSPIQMQQLLYAKLGLPIEVYSKVNRGTTRDRLDMEGSPSTDATAVDTALANHVNKDDWRHPVLLAFRSIKTCLTAKSLFYRPIPLWKHPRDGVTHPQIKNCGTVTRRPSGTSPNMLQLTKKDGGKLRSSVKPKNNEHVIVAADFNGQELRILTSECKDPVLMDAYLGEHKKDVHSITASAITSAFLKQQVWVDEHGVPEWLNDDFDYDAFIAYLKGDEAKYSHTMGDIRKAAKGVNFLIVYMGGHDALSRNIMVTTEVAKTLMDNTFERYDRIRPWQKETIEFAKTHGYTLTAWGNRRHLGKEILSSDRSISSRLERQGVNAVIQGTAAEILKECMSEAFRRKLFISTGATMIAPVYDEFVATVPRAAVMDYSFMLKEIMEITPPNHIVPMVAEFSFSSRSWGEIIEVGADITEQNIKEALDQVKEAA